MNKEVINISLPEQVKLEFGKNDIWVIPYISLKNKTKFIMDYVDTYFNTEDKVTSYVLSEYTMILSIVDTLTSIKISGDNKEDSIDIDTLIASGLWSSIKDKIKNFDEFRFDLDLIIKIITEQKMIEKSVGNILDKTSNSIIAFLDKISKLDFSQEGVTQLVEKLGEEAKKYDEKFVMTPKLPVTKIRKKKDEILQ